MQRARALRQGFILWRLGSRPTCGALQVWHSVSLMPTMPSLIDTQQIVTSRGAFARDKKATAAYKAATTSQGYRLHPCKRSWWAVCRVCGLMRTWSSLGFSFLHNCSSSLDAGKSLGQVWQKMLWKYGIVHPMIRWTASKRVSVKCLIRMLCSCKVATLRDSSVSASLVAHQTSN